jgi:hypothetical protein
VKYPRGLHSEVLDLDVVRPFIFLPQSNYDVRLRDFQASFDGAMIYGSKSVGNNSFDYKIFGGDIPIKTDSGVADFFNTSATLFKNPPGVTEVGIDSLKGAALTWTTPVQGLRFGVNYSLMKELAATGFFPGTNFSTGINLHEVNNYNVSAEYALGQWTFTGEYLVKNGELQIDLPAAFGQPARVSKFGSRDFYVSAARRIGARFEAGTYYSESRNSYPTTSGPENKRRDIAVALRFDYSEHLLFKIEAHAINGTRDMFSVPGIPNPANELKDSMALFAAKTTISF